MKKPSAGMLGRVGARVNRLYAGMPYCSFAYSYLASLRIGMSGSAFRRSASLRTGCGSQFSGLLCRSQIDQGYTDDDEDSHAHQFTACDQIKERLRPHKRGVGKARPRRESNQAAMSRWITGCQQQENAE